MLYLTFTTKITNIMRFHRKNVPFSYHLFTCISCLQIKGSAHYSQVNFWKVVPCLLNVQRAMTWMNMYRLTDTDRPLISI